MPASRDRIAPLLRHFDPDLALCLGFPWKIPPEALAVPRHGIVNGHPSLLPRYRGPSPVAWAIRNGESEIGFTFHYMDAELDTGNVLAQAAVPLGDEHGWDELDAEARDRRRETFCRRSSSGSSAATPATRRPTSEASYFRLFEPEYAWIDWSQSADEIARQVRAWRFHSPAEPRGALTELDGETVRVLSREPRTRGRPRAECADGTLWIVETEAA